MEKLEQKQGYAEKTLRRLREVLRLPFSPINRDSALLRFQLCVEAFWKYAQTFLMEEKGIDENSPKGVIRACFSVGILKEEETERALKMVNDRNLTVHTYDEDLADEIFDKLPQYCDLLAHWFDRIPLKLR